MKRLSILIAVSVCFLKTVSAQSQAVTGVVKDSLTGVLLESATISIFAKDSSLINYQLSDSYGAFQIGNLPQAKELLFNVTYVGFEPFNQTIRIDSGALRLNVLLTPAHNDSSVTVTGHIPIRMNGDTLEINPAAFKMDPNAVVEDLLTQVPGVTVWSDGTITMNGRKIPSVLVDGKPFMGSEDARLATQNLPKNAIDKIQVYQEVDRNLNPEERPQKDSLLTMNIKLKEDKKSGYFGKVGIGYGTTDRFGADLSFQMYNKKTSFGIGGGYNNINKTVENLKDMFQNNTYRNYNPNLYNVGSFNTDGINKYHSVGGVFTHNFIETTNSRQNDRITVNYTKSGTEKFLNTLSLQERTTVDNPQFIEDQAILNAVTDKHNIGVNYIKTNSYNDNFNVNGNATFSDDHNNRQQATQIRDAADQLISTNTQESVEHRTGDNEQFSLGFSRYDNRNPIAQFRANLNLNHSGNRSQRLVNSVFQSFTDSGQDTAYNRNYVQNSDDLHLGVDLGYDGFKRLILGRYNLFGISLSLNQWLNYHKSTNDEKVLDYDSSSGAYVTNARLTNHNQNEKMEYTPSIRLGKSFFKWADTYYQNFYASIVFLEDLKQDNNRSSIGVRNLSRSFAFFRYEANASYNYNRRDRFSYRVDGGYRKNFGYPGVNQLYTITDDLEVFNVRYGNPNLQNQVNHTFYANGDFNTQKPKAKYAFNGGWNGSMVNSMRPVADSVINDSSGKRYYYYVNAPKSRSFNLNYRLNLTRTLGKSNLQLRYNGSYNNAIRPNYVDNIYAQSNTIGLNNTVNLQLALRSLLILSVGKTLNHSKSRQTAAGLRSFSNRTDISRFGFTLNLPKNYTLSSTLDHTKNTNLEAPIMLWNAFATCRFLKNQQGELKFSAMDILKQFQNINNYADSYGATTRITNGLQQFFMLTFSYYPRKFGKREVRPRQVDQVW